MAYGGQNSKALELAVGGLKPGGRLRKIDHRVLRRAFGTDVTIAVEAAHDLAKQHNCVFRLDPKQGIGEFVKPNE